MVVFIAMLWSTELLAVSNEDFQTAFIEQLEYHPAKQFGIKGQGMDAESVDRVLSKIYHENNLKPFWIGTGGPGKQAKGIFETLKAADSHGLTPEHYLTDKIQKYWESTDAKGLARLDILLTLGLRGYVADMREGSIEPRKIDPKLFATARDAEVDFNTLREQALSTPDIQAFLEKQVPPFLQYHKLRKALKDYRAMKTKGGWESIPEGKILKPGMEDERVRLIRKRLSITGDLRSDDLKGTVYDDRTVQAVKRLQSRHGLEPDGIIGKNTLSALNISVDTKILQIVINMERYRWIKHQLGERVIVVNIAGFGAAGIKPKTGEIEIKMRVIVGKEFHKTPVFSDAIKYVEFNPYWNIPVSIANNEMLPKLKKNAHYLKERNIRIFNSWGPDAKELDSIAIDWKKVGKKEIARWHLRQEPGPHNALGTVKFVFPNKFNVYLHDTPSHSLFQKTKRAFSHGCIRLSQPAEMASYVLGGEKNGWGIERVKEIIEGGKREVVPLKKPFPIYILYRTVIVNPENEEVNFRADVYGRDALLKKSLFSDEF
jgi:murein L,D-transpeptidase YcbB/YkuD